MNKLVLIFLVFVSLTISAQDNKPWIAFWDSDTTHIGFKDFEDKIRIEPTLMGFTIARKFDKIMAVMEDDNGVYQSYYLTRSGEKVGIDSLFISDNTSDCESEGFIRFKDEINELVGMFDENGGIVIPAEYNGLSRVKNGLIVALKGAKKKYWAKHFKGGKNYLIDTKGEILVENFDYSKYLNFYSLKIDSEPQNDSIRQEFKGVNGQYYSLIDFEKEFNVELRTFLKTDLTKESLIDICFDSIYYWKDGQGWTPESNDRFLERNFELVKESLMKLKNVKTDYNIFVGGLHPYIYEGDSFAKYFNNCGEAKESEYPVMNVVINTNTTGEMIQNHFDFLKTDNGYKLISMTIRTGKVE